MLDGALAAARPADLVLEPEVLAICIELRLVDGELLLREAQAGLG